MTGPRPNARFINAGVRGEHLKRRMREYRERQQRKGGKKENSDADR